MSLWPLLIIGLSGVLTQTSLEKKVFVFPKISEDAHVLLKTSPEQPLRQFTVCLRFYTDLTRPFSLFSAASQKRDNEILLFKTRPTLYEVSVGNEDATFVVPHDPEKATYWESVCMTWASETGVVQLWLDGQPLPRKGLARGYDIPAELVMLLGQEQDSFAGSFDADQSFAGEMAELYLWDSVLPPNQLVRLQKDGAPKPLVDWTALDFELKGYVLVEPSLA
ncbi:hypothetical protein lerEdw1_003056 [Lerista edwardsae]|nr:hypothetical protein lerEdw1_003056 [Lerista edwardsae]